jgi:hypothetical protein
MASLHLINAGPVAFWHQQKPVVRVTSSPQFTEGQSSTGDGEHSPFTTFDAGLSLLKTYAAQSFGLANLISRGAS